MKRKKKRLPPPHKAVAPRKPRPQFGEAHARVALAVDDEAWLLIVEQCPFCGREHQFYGGPLQSEPAENLGWVIPTCAKDNLLHLRLANPRAAREAEHIRKNVTAFLDGLNA